MTRVLLILAIWAIISVPIGILTVRVIKWGSE